MVVLGAATLAACFQLALNAVKIDWRAWAAFSKENSISYRCFATVRSSIVPCFATCPFTKIATRPQIDSNSLNAWLLMKTVLPSSRSRPRTSRISRRPTGSTPSVGSSRRIRSGLFIRACASPNALHHSFGVGGNFRFRPVGHPDGFEKFAGPSLGGRRVHLGHRPKKFECLASREITGKTVVFRQIPDAGQGRFVADRLTKNVSLGACRTNNGHHNFNERALAGTVRTEQAKNLPLFHVHLNTLQGMNAPAINFGYIPQVDRKISVVQRHGSRRPSHQNVSASQHWRRSVTEKILFAAGVNGRPSRWVQRSIVATLRITPSPGTPGEGTR